MKHRVAITGLGVVSPLGIGIEENWNKIKNKVSAIAYTDFPGSDLFFHSLSGSVPEFSSDEFIQNKKLLKLMNRESLLASAAAKLAFDDASLKGFYSPDKTGIYLGTGLTSGELDYLVPLIEDSLDVDGNFSFELLGRKALSNCNPLLSFKILPNMALSYISILFDIKGQNMVFNPWSGNTAQAIGEAMRAIQNGTIQCAAVGGCDSKTHFIGFLTFSSLGLLSKTGIMHPFSSQSDGVILSEGAAIAILENYEMAEKRGAHIYAELKGYNCATDPFTKGNVSLCPDILENVIADTISDADLNVKDIDAICTGANSSPAGDASEALALHHIFDNCCPLVTGFKTLTGDMLAASSAFDFCLSSYFLSKGELIPVFNPCDINPSNPLTPASFSKTPDKCETILLNSFELGSTKTSLIIRKNK